MHFVFMSHKIRSFRVSAGLSQSALARRVGVSVRTVNYWEHGKRRPRGENIQALAAALRMTPRSLLRALADQDADLLAAP